MTSGTKKLEGFDSINTWFQHMSKIGHGQRRESNKARASNTALEQQPRAIPGSMNHSTEIGKHVSIQPNDYAKDSVNGVLVGDDESRWILARETDDFGTLHVHFPKLGFEMSII